MTPWLRLVVPAPATAADTPYELSNLLLEAPDGSLRVAEITGKPPEYPKTKALIKRNEPQPANRAA